MRVFNAACPACYAGYELNIWQGETVSQHVTEGQRLPRTNFVQRFNMSPISQSRRSGLLHVCQSNHKPDVKGPIESTRSAKHLQGLWVTETQNCMSPHSPGAHPCPPRLTTSPCKSQEGIPPNENHEAYESQLNADAKYFISMTHDIWFITVGIGLFSCSTIQFNHYTYGLKVAHLVFASCFYSGPLSFWYPPTPNSKTGIPGFLDTAYSVYCHCQAHYISVSNHKNQVGVTYIQTSTSPHWVHTLWKNPENVNQSIGFGQHQSWTEFTVPCSGSVSHSQWGQWGPGISVPLDVVIGQDGGEMRHIRSIDLVLHVRILQQLVSQQIVSQSQLLLSSWPQSGIKRLWELMSWNTMNETLYIYNILYILFI